MHIEARCTCGERFKGVGENEGEAIEALWARFKLHLGTNENILSGLNTFNL